MPEMTWKKIEDVPDEDWERGWAYINRYSGNELLTKCRAVAISRAKRGKVWGPLDMGDPPPDPPAIYRFEADWQGKRVSGDWIPDDTGNNFHVVWFDEKGRFMEEWCLLKDFTGNIHWKDTPPEGVE